VLAVMRDLRAHSVDILTLGQYLRPSPKHLPIVRYVPPAEFDDLRRAGYEMGFAHVESGPLVRSSYHAHQFALLEVLAHLEYMQRQGRIQRQNSSGPIQWYV
jgi:lipoic acid synthetase